jgi:hypothetical protein
MPSSLLLLFWSAISNETTYEYRSIKTTRYKGYGPLSELTGRRAKCAPRPPALPMSRGGSQDRVSSQAAASPATPTPARTPCPLCPQVRPSRSPRVGDHAHAQFPRFHSRIRPFYCALQTILDRPIFDSKPRKFTTQGTGNAGNAPADAAFWTHLLPLPCPNDAVPTQTGFALQNLKRDSLQSLSQVLPSDTVILIPHQRRQQSADVFTRLPAPLGFFPEQNRARDSWILDAECTARKLCRTFGPRSVESAGSIV